MFDIKNGIEVRVKPYGSVDAYDEVKAKTTSSLYANGRNECYIEAESGKRFEVEVVLHPIFQWKRARKVSVDYRIDLINNWQLIKKPTEGQAATSSCRTFITKVDGVRAVCGFEFGEVHMSDQEEFELAKRGKIEVVVQRVSAVKNDKATRKAKRDRRRGEDDSRETIQLSEETNKKVAGDKGRSHYAKHLVLRTLDAVNSDSDVTIWTHKPISDEAGNKIKFTFFYTNRGKHKVYVKKCRG
ncbi:hypothetical protein LTR56_006171 [Elasticomyces elasticus]|nr:hypothetical protein LTR22_012999 [Elasticomyces elasticus]KAK3650466.1 hypothetical protein LTR56_006171 [Elasticomyces elasticus]KAK4928196.1 hypothetical protein LTR49_005134 [Elasticomyces elasticus]KAK5765950.1 hypothetical protein LTS12_003957 [Elasticomyces elasticus]